MEIDAAERFDAVVDQYVGHARVTPPSGGGGFGRSALRVDGKIFAMFVRGRMVVKLSRVRVDGLVDAGEGVRFDANMATPMKEWFDLDPTSSLDWAALAREALDFVGGGRSAQLEA